MKVMNSSEVMKDAEEGVEALVGMNNTTDTVTELDPWGSRGAALREILSGLGEPSNGPGGKKYVKIRRQWEIAVKERCSGTKQMVRHSRNVGDCNDVIGKNLRSLGGEEIMYKDRSNGYNKV
jgi:hypothetical protein